MSKETVGQIVVCLHLLLIFIDIVTNVCLDLVIFLEIFFGTETRYAEMRLTEILYSYFTV